jgi:hypothetical protein
VLKEINAGCGDISIDFIFLASSTVMSMLSLQHYFLIDALQENSMTSVTLVCATS